MNATASGARVMTAERLSDFFEAWNAHDVDRVLEYFAADGEYLASIGPADDGTAFRGIKEVRRGVAAFLGMYPDAHYSDTQILIDGSRGHAQWTFSGTSLSGQQVRYRGVDVFEFDGDLIRLKDAYRKERAAPIGS